MSKGRGTKFILRDRRLVCENSKFNVFFDFIEGANGEVVRDYLVIAPKSRAENLITGVAILPILKKQIGLIRVYRHGIQDYSWEIPRGFIDEGEDPAISAIRELEEETGLGCKPERMKSLGYLTPEAGILQARIHIFGALECFNIRPFSGEEFGHKELRFFPTSDIARMAADFVIQDPCTLVALYRRNCI
ncbi:MAG: NUDIX hydrolase [Nitrospirae bacterium]|nr:NUDIX hydrolase [Candidatus Manganitrophaceae bacterium]